MSIIRNETTFICGSSSIKNLDNNIKQRLDSIMSVGINIVLGEYNNFDYLLQDYLTKARYDRVCIYYSRKRCRHNLNNWQTKHIKAVNFFGKITRTDEEIAMINDANYGLVIWDSKSMGAEFNIDYMVSKNKKVAVYKTDTKRFVWY